MAAMESRLPELDALLKTSKGRMTADLIRQISEIPDVYRYRNRLLLPNVQELRKTECAPAVDLLTLFSQGSYKAYVQASTTLPQLTEKQLFVLRCLSLASLARNSDNQKIPFKTIQEDLGLTDDWQVFDFLIEALNYGYVTGKLDELAKALYIEDFVTRDIEVDEEKFIRAKLNTFLSACDQTMDRIRTESGRIDELKKQADAQKKELAVKLSSMKNNCDDVMSMPAEEDLYRSSKPDFGGGANKFMKTRSKGSTKSGGGQARRF